jgi:hypothetical protein
LEFDGRTSDSLNDGNEQFIFRNAFDCQDGTGYELNVRQNNTRQRSNRTNWRFRFRTGSVSGAFDDAGEGRVQLKEAQKIKG